MSIEQNRRVAKTIIEALGKRDVKTVLNNIHEDGTWSIPFNGGGFKYGIKSKADFSERLSAFLSTFAEFNMSIQSITAENDRVAVEANAWGVSLKGLEYSNIYYISFIMKDGKAFRVVEFLDPFIAINYLNHLNNALP